MPPTLRLAWLGRALSCNAHILKDFFTLLLNLWQTNIHEEIHLLFLLTFLAEIEWNRDRALAAVYFCQLSRSDKSVVVGWVERIFRICINVKWRKPRKCWVKLNKNFIMQIGNALSEKGEKHTYIHMYINKYQFRCSTLSESDFKCSKLHYNLYQCTEESNLRELSVNYYTVPLAINRL